MAQTYTEVCTQTYTHACAQAEIEDVEESSFDTRTRAEAPVHLTSIQQNHSESWLEDDPVSAFKTPKHVPSGWRGPGTSAQTYAAYGAFQGYGYGYGMRYGTDQQGDQNQDAAENNGQGNGRGTDNNGGRGGGGGGGGGRGGGSRGSDDESGRSNKNDIISILGPLFVNPVYLANLYLKYTDPTPGGPPDGGPPDGGAPDGGAPDGGDSNPPSDDSDLGLPKGNGKSSKNAAILPIYIQKKSTGTRRMKVGAILDTSSSENCVSESFLRQLKIARGQCRMDENGLKLFDRAVNKYFEGKRRVEIHWELQDDDKHRHRQSDFIVSPALDYDILFGSDFIRQARKQSNLHQTRQLRDLLAALAQNPELGDLGRATVQGPGKKVRK